MQVKTKIFTKVEFSTAGDVVDRNVRSTYRCLLNYKQEGLEVLSETSKPSVMTDMGTAVVDKLRIQINIQRRRWTDLFFSVYYQYELYAFLGI